MANIASARKRARQAMHRRRANMAQRSALRTSLRLVTRAIAAGDREAANAAFRQAVPVIDGAVTKGLIHRNKADRQKSRLNRHIRALA